MTWRNKKGNDNNKTYIIKDLQNINLEIAIMLRDVKNKDTLNHFVTRTKSIVVFIISVFIVVLI